MTELHPRVNWVLQADRSNGSSRLQGYLHSHLRRSGRRSRLLAAPHRAPLAPRAAVRLIRTVARPGAGRVREALVRRLRPPR